MISSLQKDFAHFAGELAESLSFNKSMGQIYGLLYISSSPLSLDDIAKQLNMSKGNASINLRILESWDAVCPVWVAGSRRDHYEANRDLKSLALRRLQEGLGRRLEIAARGLRALSASGIGHMGPAERKSIQELESIIAKGYRIRKILPKVLRFL
jgi:HTH-type transcriptional regulator, glycine betaine synthesis regulator